MSEENSEYEDPSHVVTKFVNNIQICELLNTDQLKVLQQNDPFCQEKSMKKEFTILDDLLYKTDKGLKLLVLTDEIAKEIAEYCHRCKGHLGYKRLHDYLKTTFYAKNLDKTCKEVRSGCADCISVKYKKP